MNGFLDGLPVSAVGRFESGLIDYLKSQKPEVLTTIRDSKDLAGDTATALKDAVTAFAKTFA